MFGHPPGLKTLFFTELWERMSYYGMRAILVLFLAAEVEKGGFGMDIETASAIYGLYTAMVYLVALPGGWIADRILGMQRSVLYGGMVIACGHFSMAVPSEATFYLGLALIVIGTGLLKPNISAIVGELYPDKGGQRDAGFSIYYMGINLGAFIGPLICGYLGQKVDWHWGFGAAGVGMVLGLIQYQMGRLDLGRAGLEPSVSEQERQASLTHLLQGLCVTGLVFLLGWALHLTGIWSFSITVFVKFLGILIALLTLVYFGLQLNSSRWNRDEKRGIFAILFLVIAAAVFWAGFEQAGSSMNLFAEYFTDLSVPSRDGTGMDTIPASWFQSLNPLYIILLAPLFAWFWGWLQHRNPSIPTKFGCGLALLAVGFLILGWGATYTGSATAEEVKGDPTLAVLVSPNWLVVTYLFHTMGELCLSPIGLSSVTKLSPRPLVGQMMGMWFMGAALGNLLAGMTAGLFDEMERGELFWSVALWSGAAGALMACLPLRRLFGSVR